jgi:peptide deformylase
MTQNFTFLREKSLNFDFATPPFEPIEFAQELVKTMYDGGGISLAAPQIGIGYRVFAMRGEPQNFVCYNPRVVMPSTELVTLEETSLTWPGMSVKITRPRHVKVRFALPNSEIKTETFSGITARVFQQCLDFLDGHEYYRHANPIHREKALRQHKLWMRKNRK